MDTLKDRNGEPLLVDSFVRVSCPGLVAGRTQEFRGLVVSVTEDAHGVLLQVSEWKGGRMTGRTRLTRPAHCETVRGPAALREEQARRARILVRAKEKA